MAAKKEGSATPPTPGVAPDSAHPSKRIFSALTYTYVCCALIPETTLHKRVILIPGENWVTEEQLALLQADKGYIQRRDASMIQDSPVLLPKGHKRGALFVKNTEIAKLRHLSQELRNPDRREEHKAIAEAATKGTG